MIGLVVKTVREGRWLIFTFHDVGGEHLQVSVEKLSGFLEFLDGKRDKV
jgi:hypothetical protein